MPKGRGFLSSKIVKILKEIEDKTKKHLRNVAIAGAVGSIAGVGTRKGLRRGIAKETIIQRRIFRDVKQTIHEQFPNKGDAESKLFKLNFYLNFKTQIRTATAIGINPKEAGIHISFNGCSTGASDIQTPK